MKKMLLIGVFVLFGCTSNPVETDTANTIIDGQYYGITQVSFSKTISGLCSHSTSVWSTVFDSLDATDFLMVQRDTVYLYKDNFSDTITEYAVSRSSMRHLEFAKLFEGFYMRSSDTLCNGNWICNMHGILNPVDSERIAQYAIKKVRF
jgi:heme oxygenase